MIRWLKTHRYAYWALTLIFILSMYFLPERLVVTEYTPTQIPLDDFIPFWPGFVVFYVLWFPMLGLTGLWLLFKDGDAFKRYMWFLTIAYGLSAVFFLLFPNGQDLRPALGPSGVFEMLLSRLYAADTNTNVLPSLHVVGAIAVTAGLYDTPTTRGSWVRPVAAVLSALVAVSTVLVKQHAILDLFAGLALGAALYILVYVVIKRGMQARRKA